MNLPRLFALADAPGPPLPTPPPSVKIQKIGSHQIWSESGKSQFFSDVGRV